MVTMRAMEITRRQFIQGLGGAAILAGAPAAARAGLVMPSARSLRFDNVHTGEKLTATYWEDGAYLPDALAEISRVLRDHRTNEIAAMDPKLMDILSALQYRLGVKAPLQVISGYRSPVSNAALAARSRGVAKHSLHMQAKAIDIRIPGVALSDVRNAALALGQGGVGYYPTSDFVHVDTGRVRRW